MPLTTTNFTNELKATNYASSPKSGSGYAATDLIQLYANDGTPNGKISRTDLMSCVKDSLGSLLNAAGADQSTNAAKVPTINSSGVLGSSTIANMASVLGAVRASDGLYASADLDNIRETMITYCNAGLPANWPTDKVGTFLCFAAIDNRTIQFVFGNIFTDYNIYFRSSWGMAGAWGAWKKISFVS